MQVTKLHHTNTVYNYILPTKYKTMFVLSIVLLLITAEIADSQTEQRHLRQTSIETTSKSSSFQLLTDYSTYKYIVTYQFADKTCNNFIPGEDITLKSYTSVFAYAQLQCFQDYSYTGNGQKYFKYKIQTSTPNQADGYYIQYFFNNNQCSTVPPDAVGNLITINNCTVSGTTSSYTTLSVNVPTFASVGAMFA